MEVLAYLVLIYTQPHPLRICASSHFNIIIIKLFIYGGFSLFGANIYTATHFGAFGAKWRKTENLRHRSYMEVLAYFVLI